MRRIILFLLVLPLAAAQGTFNEEIIITGDDVSLRLNLSGIVAWECAEAEVKDHCGNFSFTGLPSSIDAGEKLSFGFTGWQENDSVTYWVEDIHGTILKDEYTTTSATKKSYTPKLVGEEQALVFKAERVRKGCEELMAERMVIVVGEPLVCEEPEPVIITETCKPEEQVSSLYVRAKNWQERIVLYGNAAAGTYLLFGEETLRTVDLSGGFSLNITPRKGENTYGLVAEDGGIPMLVTFTLSYEEEEPEEPAMNATLVIAPPITGDVILENGTKKNTTVIAGLSGLAGAGLALSSIKTKLLRRRHGSA